MGFETARHGRCAKDESNCRMLAANSPPVIIAELGWLSMVAELHHRSLQTHAVRCSPVGVRINDARLPSNPIQGCASWFTQIAAIGGF